VEAKENELVDFIWAVAEHYEWRALRLCRGKQAAPPDGLGPPEPALTTGRGHREQVRWRWYQPLREDPALFRNFAGLLPYQGHVAGFLPYQGHVLDFARRYGLLGEPQAVEIKPGDLEVEASAWRGFMQAEPLSFWVRQITEMRHALELWDLVRAGDEDGLRKHIRWEEVAPDRWKLTHRFREDGQADEIPQSIPLQPPFLSEPALLYIQLLINEEMSPRVQGRLLKDLSTGAIQLKLRPVNLLGALWLQFAEAVSGGKKYRACPQCGRYFELSGGAPGGGRSRRSDKVFCSSACRYKAHVGRREAAKRMRAEGKRPKVIAEALGATVEDVRKWTSSKRK
jgi:hypothetical protein